MKIIEKETTVSTNTDAKNLAEKGADDFTVVWSHEQTGGRGRNDRKWVSLRGNVFWSIILRPSEGWHQPTDLVFVNALAVRKTVASVIGDQDDVLVKWPNDIIINERKIAGSLIETSGFQGGKMKWVVVGTGINVAHHPEGQDMLYPPTSIHALGYQDVTYTQVIAELNKNMVSELKFWIENGFGAVRERYLGHAFRLNQTIHVGLNTDKSDYRYGVYKGIDETGSLLLDSEDGERLKLHSGDVFLQHKD